MNYSKLTFYSVYLVCGLQFQKSLVEYFYTDSNFFEIFFVPISVCIAIILAYEGYIFYKGGLSRSLKEYLIAITILVTSAISVIPFLEIKREENTSLTPKSKVDKEALVIDSAQEVARRSSAKDEWKKDGHVVKSNKFELNVSRYEGKLGYLLSATPKFIKNREKHFKIITKNIYISYVETFRDGLSLVVYNGVSSPNAEFTTRRFIDSELKSKCSEDIELLLEEYKGLIMHFLESPSGKMINALVYVTKGGRCIVRSQSSLEREFGSAQK